MANPPASGLKLGALGEPPASATWLLTRIETPALRPYFGATLAAPVLLLDPASDAQKRSATPAGNDAVLNLPRHWHPNTFPPERHIGYALTWFGFALTALIIFYLLHRESS